MYPLLYVVIKDDRPSYILGVANVGARDVGVLPKRLCDYIKRCRAFYTEISDITAEECLGDFEPDTRRMYNDLRDRYKDFIDPNARPAHEIFSLLLRSASPLWKSDELLKAQLVEKARGLQVDVECFDDDVFAGQFANIIEALYIDEAKVIQHSNYVVQAFTLGSEELLGKLRSVHWKDEKIREFGLKRNQEIARMVMQQCRPTFYCIGHENLLEEGGVLSLLRSVYGYTVERIHFSLEETGLIE